MKKALPIVALFFVVAATHGCGSTRLPTIQKLAPLPQKNICRIVVLPFSNETSFEQGGVIAYRAFVAEFSRMGKYHLVQEGDLRNVYNQLKIYPGETPDFEQKRFIAEFFGADLIITGTIVEMSEKKIKNIVNPTLALYIEFYDPATGRTIWSTYHRRQGDQYRQVMHFGVINNITKLTQKVFQELWALWQEEGLQKCGE